MKNSILKLIVCSVICSAIFISCAKDKDKPKSSDSRNVRYEITGTARGTYDATYITGNATGASATPTSLPWSKEEVMKAGITTITISSAVIGATPGQTITTKIYVGGVEKNSRTETVQANGTGIIAALSYTLK